MTLSRFTGRSAILQNRTSRSAAVCFPASVVLRVTTHSEKSPESNKTYFPKFTYEPPPRTDSSAKSVPHYTYQQCPLRHQNTPRQLLVCRCPRRKILHGPYIALWIRVLQSTPPRGLLYCPDISWIAMALQLLRDYRFGPVGYAVRMHRLQQHDLNMLRRVWGLN